MTEPRTPRETKEPVLLVHGIAADRDEGGMYARLADALAERGHPVLRFSFRGHGTSGGTQRGITIAGECLDIDAATNAVRQRHARRPVIVASSFGAVPTLETAPYLRPSRLVLWNPVLDLRRTFVEPELPWGHDNFSPASRARAMADGSLLVDGEFEIGRCLLTEFLRYDPAARLREVTVPLLVVHGDQDSYVSYDIARELTDEVGGDFHTVHGADHGFDGADGTGEDEAIATTLDWLRTRSTPTFRDE